jgi:hypothetical protein
VASRTAGVVPDTPALIITEGYVGVCCSSLKKLWGVLKKNILKRMADLPPPRTRDNDYDGMVVPRYRQFPFNAEACERITDAAWNPPTQVICRWLEMCRPEGWTHLNLTRVICLRPLDLNMGDSPLKMLKEFTLTVKDQLETIASLKMWYRKVQVKMIMIPLRIGDSWMLYQTVRSGSQTVMKIAGGFKDGNSNSVKEAIKSVDAILHALGRGTLKIWLRMLVRDLQGGEPDVVAAR